jgi:hypothetical protein
MASGVRQHLARVGWRRTFAVLLSAVALAATRADAATSGVIEDAEHLRRLDALMLALRPESVRDARRIREAYGARLHEIVFPDRAALQLALAGDVVRPLPEDLFNLRPRLRGAHPIGEKDIAYQSLYLAARASTLGCLFHVAAAVRATPLEVTSLVRHLAYQEALQRTNRNAQAAIPLHAAGLAFDISVLHAPTSAAIEIRDALRHLRDAGYLYFVAETRQFVFHVVPAPARLDFYTHLFHALTSLPAPQAPQLPYVCRSRRHLR